MRYEPGLLPDAAHRHPWRVVGGGAVVVAMWLTGAVVWPRVQEAAALWQAVQARRAQVTAVVAGEVLQTHLAARRLALETRRAALAGPLPPDDPVSTLLHALQAYAGPLAVRLNQVRQGARVSHAAHDELPLSLDLEGTFHGVAAYLDEVERSPYLIRVQALAVDAGPGPLPAVRAHVTLGVMVPRTPARP